MSQKPSNAPGRTRTCDLVIRNHSLCPPELRGRQRATLTYPSARFNRFSRSRWNTPHL